jgi:seryl-tRNA synthetase
MSKAVIIRSPEGQGQGSKILDAETGKEISGVRSVTIKIEATKLNKAIVEIYCPFVEDVKAEAEFVYIWPVELRHAHIICGERRYRLVEVTHLENAPSIYEDTAI